jgi:ATP-dependent protease HslVU (ClpYQ) ATPase subunit
MVVHDHPMTRTNHALVVSLLKAIDGFVTSDLGIEEIQGRLEVCMELLERGPEDFATPIRDAETDLEAIQYTMLLTEQRPAAVFRLDSLREALASRLRRENG